MKRNNASLQIGSFKIENFGKPLVIAEIASNHNGDMNLARKLIDVAKDAGADYVKFQSFTKNTTFSKKVYEENCFLSDDYRNRTDFTLEQIVEAYSISEAQLIEMREYCDKVKIGFSSTPFSKKETDFLVDVLKADFIKVASMDLNNYYFLDYLAKKGKPIILSTGLSTLQEIDKAVATIEKTGNKQLAILHCVANYPPKDENVNLHNIDMLRDNYPNYPVGYSDHSIGTAIPLAAVAKGACIIEKHLTLDKDMPGWDHKVSATGTELKEIVDGGIKIMKGLGSYRRVITDDDITRIPAFRRSIVAAKAIPAGKIIEDCDLDVKRPGTGIAPEFREWLVGKAAKRSITFDEMIKVEDV